MQDDTTAPTGGVDWATDTNEQCIVDDAGVTLLRRNSVCDASGIHRLVEEIVRHGVHQVAIERPDGPVVDALLSAGLEVVVIAPRQVSTCAPATGRRATKTTASTPTSWLTCCAPTATGSPRCTPTARRRWRCAAPCAPAPTWSRHAWRRATSCAPTCASYSPPRWGCSPTSTPRSAWRSSPASPTPAAPPG